MSTPESTVFIALLTFGIILFLAGLIGKVKAPSLELDITNKKFVRIFLSLFGLSLMVVAFGFAFPIPIFSATPTPSQSSPQVTSDQSTPPPPGNLKDCDGTKWNINNNCLNLAKDFLTSATPLDPSSIDKLEPTLDNLIEAIPDGESQELRHTKSKAYAIRALMNITLKKEDNIIFKDATMAKQLDQYIDADFENQGDFYKNKKMYDKSAEEYKMAIAIQAKTNPDGKPNTHTEFNLGEAYHMKGESGQGGYDSAIPVFNNVISADPNYTAAYFYRGLDNNAIGDYPKSINDLEMFLSLHPSDKAKINQAYKKLGEMNAPTPTP